MEREAIINYLKEVKRILDKRYAIQDNFNAWVLATQIRNLLLNENLYDDEELLHEAMYYEDIKPLDFND